MWARTLNSSITCGFKQAWRARVTVLCCFWGVCTLALPYMLLAACALLCFKHSAACPAMLKSCALPFLLYCRTGVLYRLFGRNLDSGLPV
jgi:hypothetical protein